MLAEIKDPLVIGEESTRIWRFTTGSSNRASLTKREVACTLSEAEHIGSLSEAHSLISSIAAHFGFEYASTFNFIPSILHNHAVHSSDSSWAWIKYYRDNACFKTDPSMRYIKAHRSPFSWDSSYYKKTIEALLSTEEKRFVTTAMDFGITQVVCMPFYGAGGDRGAFRFMRISERPLTSTQLHRFFSQSFYSFHLLYEKQLSLLRKELKADDEPKLTLKEVSVLSLCALGKNPSRIADQLGISHNTVQQHLRNIRNKLGVRNTVHAIAKAGTCGLLSAR